MMLAEDRSDVDMVKGILADPKTVLPQLGFKARHDGSGWKILCPWHDERTPSCSVQVRDGVLLAKCHGCGKGGDVISLVAAVERLTLPRDFREALQFAANIAGIALSDGDAPKRYVERPQPVPVQPKPYPPIADVRAVWGMAAPVGTDSEATAWLRSRGLEPDRIEEQQAARVLGPSMPLPQWAAFRGSRDHAVPWTATGHRIVVAMRDCAGAIQSIRARSIVDSDDPKALPPSGYRSSGIVMACPIATMMLASGAWPAFADGRLVIVEGEPDFLSWAGRSPGPRMLAVIGITSGAWTPEIAAKVPNDSRVIIRTDLDTAGDKYAEAIRATLEPRCTILRKVAT